MPDTTDLIWIGFIASLLALVPFGSDPGNITESGSARILHARYVG